MYMYRIIPEMTEAQYFDSDFCASLNGAVKRGALKSLVKMGRLMLEMVKNAF